MGDWHAGAQRYRTWIEQEGGWHNPDRPVVDAAFKGWLRVHP
jgi:hypothetical protein